MATQINTSRRLDQWLWYARIFKTRGAASKFCQTGKVTIDGIMVNKAKTPVNVGVILSFKKDKLEKVLKIEGLGYRRGPAIEAQALYEDLSPPPPTKEGKLINSPMLRERGTGRPTKAERRAMEKLRPDMKLKPDI